MHTLLLYVLQSDNSHYDRATLIIIYLASRIDTVLECVNNSEGIDGIKQRPPLLDILIIEEENVYNKEWEEIGHNITFLIPFSSVNLLIPSPVVVCPASIFQLYGTQVG